MSAILMDVQNHPPADVKEFCEDFNTLLDYHHIRIKADGEKRFIVSVRHRVGQEKNTFSCMRVAANQGRGGVL